MQAGLRSELEIATDEMERAQRQLAALEKQREVLQQDAAASSPRAASRVTPSRAVEDSLRKELQGQVLLPSGPVCTASPNPSKLLAMLPVLAVLQSNREHPSGL